VRRATAQSMTMEGYIDMLSLVEAARKIGLWKTAATRLIRLHWRSSIRSRLLARRLSRPVRCATSE
jgi:hypothetical protein